MKRSGLRVVVVWTTLDILGGQGVQACRLIEGLEGEGLPATFIPINPFSKALACSSTASGCSTVLNQLMHAESRARGTRTLFIFRGRIGRFCWRRFPR